MTMIAATIAKKNHMKIAAYYNQSLFQYWTKFQIVGMGEIGRSYFDSRYLCYFAH